MLVFEDSGFGALLALVLLAGALGGRPDTLQQYTDADYASSAAAPDCPCLALLAARLRLETARSLGARVALFPGSPPAEPDPAGGAAAESHTLVLSAAAECPDSVPQDQAAVQLAVRVRAELQVRVPERPAACRAQRCAF